MTRIQRIAAGVLVALAVPVSVQAQDNHDGWGGRAFLSFNAGVQTASPNFSYDASAALFSPTNDTKAGLDVPGRTGQTFDIGGGVRLVQNLGVGVTYSRYSRERNATLIMSLPYYLYPDTITQEIPLRRTEDAVHIQAIYRIPIGNRVQVGAFGGPTYFRCLDNEISSFAFQESYAPVAGYHLDFHTFAQTLNRESVWGYHGGANVTYMAAKHVGVGMNVRYSRASHTTTNPLSNPNSDNLYWNGVWASSNPTETVTMTHGGMHWNGGVSLHF